MTRVVGIGGGHGLAVTLAAARRYADDVTAVVTVADDGGSSGRLARDLGIPAPGDIRRCLCALATDEAVAALYRHRFGRGELTGHSAGNLVIAALAEMTGDFGVAVKRAGDLLGVDGRVYPATTQRVELRATVGNRVVSGQVAVASSTPIQAVYLEPIDPPAYAPAVGAILAADQVVLGPGSLFTSLIACLLVPGIRRAVQETAATRVFVCNSRRQKGETEELDAAGHVEALLAHAGPFAVDVAVLQQPELSVDGVRVERGALGFLGVRTIEADLAGSDGGHDPERLAEVLRGLRPSPNARR